MKSKFLMTLPVLLTFPIVSASCTDINQNNSTAENKKPDSNEKNKVDNATTSNANSNENKNEGKSKTEQPSKDKAETYSISNINKQKEEMLKGLKGELTKLKEKKVELEKTIKESKPTEEQLKKAWQDIENKANTSPSEYDENKLKDAYDKWLSVYVKLTNAKNELEILTKSKKIEQTEQAIEKIETELKAK
ncbi:hypothetical protein [Mycoplasmopsis agalactiae]|uniref:hypothetical protein n=1 Tax=Mycoplasmopsis agalactiae TaxID=2110 RepID=UPI001F42A9A7|nr:hypothetical protein [Mycoplasmopsis agalactiae]MCE6115457.1 hypothetical protein [Mycoplasmopsis agalactiae]